LFLLYLGKIKEEWLHFPVSPVEIPVILHVWAISLSARTKYLSVTFSITGLGIHT